MICSAVWRPSNKYHKWIRKKTGIETYKKDDRNDWKITKTALAELAADPSEPAKSPLFPVVTEVVVMELLPLVD